MLPALSFFVALGVVVLQPGARVERAIAGGITQVFQVSAAEGEFVSAVIDQRERDLIVTVYGPDGRAIARVDEWDRGAELVSLSADLRGVYRFEVQALKPDRRPSIYTIQIEVRARRTNDARRVRAATLATEAKQLFEKKDAVSLRASIARRREVLDEWRAVGERAPELATLMGIGDALYRLSEFDAAEHTYQDALTLNVKLGDERSRAELLNNLGMLEWPKGNVAAARRFLEGALSLWEALHVEHGRAATLTNLSILAWEAGNLDEARRLNVRALEIFKALHDRRGEAYVLGNAAIVAEALGRRRDGIANLSRAVRGFHQTGDRIAEGRGLVRLARMRLADGDLTGGVADVRRSFPLIQDSAERLAEGDAHETLARAHAEASDWAAARADYARALELYQAVGNRRGLSNVWHGLGMIALAERDGAGAVMLLSKARELRHEIGVRSLEAETLFEMASSAELGGELTLARTCLETAIAIIEQVRATVLERELRTSYGATVQRYYARYVDVLIAMHRLQPDAGYADAALAAADRAKARGVAESLAEAWAGPPSESDPALVKRERDLRQEIAHVSWAVWTASEQPASTDSEQRQARLDRLLREHVAVEADIRRLEPKYAPALNPPPVSIGAIQRDVLDSRSVLLEYVLGSTRSYVWAVTSTGSVVVDLPPGADVERAARAFRTLASSPEIAANNRQLHAASSALSRLLLSPVAPWLEQRVVLVVDGVLASVPWSALDTPGRSVPFGEGREILTVSSTMSLALMRDALQHPPAPKPLAILADPVMTASDPRVTRAHVATLATTGVPLRRLARLPFSRHEALAIAALAADASPPLTALDFDASRARLIDPELRQYRVIHVSSHASRDPKAPALSSIVLSLVDRQGSPVDGFVRLQDIVHLELNAELVVLSACSTGLEASARADGVTSLGRAFLAAGARRVIMSQWDVDDAATAFLMERFYQHLFFGNSTSPAAALAAAQAEMRKSRRFSRPSFWAGWVLTGADW